MSQKDVFTEIYKKQICGDSSEKNPLSWRGSNPMSPDHAFFRQKIEANLSRAVLDVGQVNWTIWRDDTSEKLSNIGIDLSREISRVLDERNCNCSRTYTGFDLFL